MKLLAELQSRFAQALSQLVDDPAPYASMVRVAQDSRFGDFQANCAMPLAKQLKQKPPEIAQRIIDLLEIGDFCETPEVAGPGFINIRLKTDWLQNAVNQLVGDERLGVTTVDEPQTIVIDYSGPNVAKPMHVGHLRSTVIGAALYHILTFQGHRVIGDNHIGDWGTQFGKIIYGYKHFRDEAAFQQETVEELARLYRLVTQLEGYQKSLTVLPELEDGLTQQKAALEQLESEVDPKDKSAKKKLKKSRESLAALQEELRVARQKIAEVEANKDVQQLADAHPNIAASARQETAKLHSGDVENQQLWNEFLPASLTALGQVYDRLGISFDMTKGESDYHPMLAGVVESLKEKGLATESDGATVVFCEGRDTPFLIQKGDGAYTYATTDLATIQYRVEELNADELLYVVGTPQSDHFQMLFEVSRKWGFDQLKMVHVNFGSVLDEYRKIFRTRSGDTVGLESLIDEAITRAHDIVVENDPENELGDQRRQEIAEIVGIGGIKFADLYHSRESDYVFNWEKMLSTVGDTGTYLQYAFARCHGIFRRGDVDLETLQNSDAAIQLTEPEERQLALQLCRLEEALLDVVKEYRPNLLTDYLLNLSKAFTKFFGACHVLGADTEELRNSRLQLCLLTARTLQLGLSLLGIQTAERM